MTGATFGKLSQTRTSTGQCPTFAYIMKHSQATQDLSHDVPNAYRKITHSGVAPKTLPDNGTHGHPKKQRHPEPNTSTTPSSNQVSVAAVLMMGDLSLSHYLPIPPCTSAWNAGGPTHRTNAPALVKRPTISPDLTQHVNHAIQQSSERCRCFNDGRSVTQPLLADTPVHKCLECWGPHPQNQCSRTGQAAYNQPRSPLNQSIQPPATPPWRF